MKRYIKDFNGFIKESSLFIPRNVDSRFEDLKKPYIDKGYKSEEIYIGDVVIKHKDELVNYKYKVIIGDFNCSANELTSLEGCPIEVNYFSCYGNKLTNLKGGPQIVNADFYCSMNSLTSLEGGPIIVKGLFECAKNLLTSLKGCPKEVGGDFDCGYNSKKFSIEEVKEECNVKGKIYI